MFLPPIFGGFLIPNLISLNFRAISYEKLGTFFNSVAFTLRATRRTEISRDFYKGTHWFVGVTLSMAKVYA